jgi:hypothetical protein
MAAAEMRQFYERHAISRVVGNRRPYTPYEQGSKLLKDHWPSSKSFATRIANQAPGIIIPRFAPPFLGLPHVVAEIRPDKEVITSTHYHYHGEPTSEELVIPTTGSRLPRRYMHAPSEMAIHIVEDHAGIRLESRGDAKWDVARALITEKPELNLADVHLFENWAKYVFCSGASMARRIDMHPTAFAQWERLERDSWYRRSTARRAGLVRRLTRHVFDCSKGHSDREELVYLVPLVRRGPAAGGRVRGLHRQCAVSQLLFRHKRLRTRSLHSLRPLADP